MHVVSELFGPQRRWTLPPSLVEQCRRFGHAQAEAYTHRVVRAKQWVSGENTATACADARIGECIFAVEVGYNPDRVLDWKIWQPGASEPSGYDMVWRGQKIEIKRTTFSGHYLIWPVTKKAQYDTADFDYLVLVKNERNEGEVWGFISKWNFSWRRRTAKADHPLEEGTWYLEDGWLDPVEGTPGIDNGIPYKPPFEAEFMAELHGGRKDAADGEPEA